MLYFSYMKTAILTTLLALTTGFGWAQTAESSVATLDLHITQETSRMDLAEMQKVMRVQGVGFRYDLINWQDDLLQSIRLAVRLADGTLENGEFSSLSPETDIRILLIGQGEERVFCVGIDCPE
jgi:hypothetical protein